MATTVINLETNQPEEIPETDLKGAFLSGKYGLVGNQLPVRSPDGSVGVIDPSHAAAAFHQGYEPISQEEHQAALEKEKYGSGLGNTLRAGVGSALSSGTLGLTDVLERAVAPEQADIEQKVRQYNPGASTVGGLLGGAALVAATGGLGGVGAAAEGAEAAEAAGGLTGALGKLGARVATDTAYGAAFGGQQQVSEAALGDHELTAEHLLSGVASGALWGGATGLGLWGVAKAASPVLEKAQGALKGLGETMQGIAEKLGAGGEELANKDVTALTNNLDDALETHRKLGSEMRGADGLREQEASSHLMAADPAPIKADLQARIDAADQQLGEMVQGANGRYSLPIIDKAKAVIDSMREDVDSATNAYELRTAARDAADALGGGKTFKLKNANSIDQNTLDAVKDMYGDLRDHLTSTDLYGEQGAREAEIRTAEHNMADKSWAREDSPAVKAFRKEFGYSGSKSLQADPGKVKSFLKLCAAGDPRAALKQDALDGMFKAMSDYSQQAGKSFANIPLSADADNYLSIAKKQVETLRNNPGLIQQGATSAKAAMGPAEGGLRELAAKGIESVPLVGPPVASIVKNPGKAVEILGKMAQVSDKAVRAMKGGVNTFLKGTGTTGGGLLAHEILDSHALARASEGDTPFEKRTNEVNKLTPDVMAQKLTDSVGPLQDSAPKIAAHLSGLATNQAQYLKSIDPRNPNDQFAINPMAVRSDPSREEMRNYAMGFQGATKPIESMNQMLASGMVNKHALAAINACFPKIAGQYSDHIFEKVSTSKTPLTYAQKLTLSQLTGAQLARSMTPAGISAIQSTYAAAPPSRPPAGKKPPASMLGKMHLSEGVETQSEHRIGGK